MELGVPVSTGVSLLVGPVCGLGQEVYVYILTHTCTHMSILISVLYISIYIEESILYPD